MPSTQKFIHGVSPDLVRNSTYRNYANIESHALTAGSTVQFFPGTYEMGNVTFDNINLEGIGARESIVLCNANATFANTVTIRNLTFSGNSAVAASSSASLFITAATNAAAVIRFEAVNFTTGDFGVDNQGLAALSFNRCDFTGVDKAIKSNSVVSANVSFTLLNSTSNAYFTGANAALKAIQVRSSFSGGSNTGNTVKTVSANVA
jgi:xanthine dehydrogenase molybdopterin-binding subunit B